VLNGELVDAFALAILVERADVCLDQAAKAR
jgi:hypothetical protein